MVRLCVCIVVTGVIVSVFVILVVLLIWNEYVCVIVGVWVILAGCVSLRACEGVLFPARADARLCLRVMIPSASE